MCGFNQKLDKNIYRIKSKNTFLIHSSLKALCFPIFNPELFTAKEKLLQTKPRCVDTLLYISNFIRKRYDVWTLLETDIGFDLTYLAYSINLRNITSRLLAGRRYIDPCWYCTHVRLAFTIRTVFLLET